LVKAAGGGEDGDGPRGDIGEEDDPAGGLTAA